MRFPQNTFRRFWTLLPEIPEQMHFCSGARPGDVWKEYEGRLPILAELVEETAQISILSSGNISKGPGSRALCLMGACPAGGARRLNLLQILSGKVYICADTVDHIFQVGRDSFFRRRNIPFLNPCTIRVCSGERVIDPTFQGIVD